MLRLASNTCKENKCPNRFFVHFTLLASFSCCVFAEHAAHETDTSWFHPTTCTLLLSTPILAFFFLLSLPLSHHVMMIQNPLNDSGSCMARCIFFKNRHQVCRSCSDELVEGTQRSYSRDCFAVQFDVLYL